MAFGFGTQGAGSFWWGVGGLGMRGADVPATGEHAPAYLYPSLQLPADADVQFTAWLTRTPPSGFTVYPDGSYHYVGPNDFLLFELRAWNQLDPRNIGYGPGVSRVDLVTGSGPTLTGAVALDDAAPGGTLGGPAAGGVLGGNVNLDGVEPGGGLDGVLGGSLAGQVQMADAIVGGVMVGDITNYVGPMEAGMRVIRAGRQVPQKLAVLDVAEVDNLRADMSTVIGADDPIVAVGVTCEARVGTDPRTNPVIFGAWQIDGQQVWQRIKGELGVVGVTYLLRVTAVSLSGRTALAAGFVKVVRQA